LKISLEKAWKAPGEADEKYFCNLREREEIRNEGYD